MLLSQWKVEIDDRIYPLRTLLRVNFFREQLVDLSELADWNNRDLWLVRGGGWGDLLCMTPLVRQIKQWWPRVRLHIACGKQYHGLFYGLDVIEEQLPIPFESFIALISFEELIESHPDAQEIHIIDLFARKAGVTLSDRSIHYLIRTEELREAHDLYPRNGKPRIAVQFLASALYRTYQQMQFVIKELSKDCEIYIFGIPGQVEFKPYPNIINLMDKKLTFRQSAAVLATCDVCVAPDSALVHLSSALNVPCVALYGAMPSFLRTSGSVIGINGKAPCAPCFFHAEGVADFPQDKPCTQIRKCVAIEGIPIDKIVQKVRSLMTNKIL